jgi:hypothetical protein
MSSFSTVNVQIIFLEPNLPMSPLSEIAVVRRFSSSPPRGQIRPLGKPPKGPYRF